MTLRTYCLQDDKVLNAPSLFFQVDHTIFVRQCSLLFCQSVRQISHKLTSSAGVELGFCAIRGI